MPHAALAAATPGAGVAPDAALQRLVRGNHAYVREMIGSRVNTIEERAELVQAIQPAIKRSETTPGDALLNATEANAVITADHLRRNDILMGLIAKHKLKIVAAYCDLATGKVSWL